MEYKKCFVPSCQNSSTTTPDKLIVRIREDLREKWCRHVNVEYFKVYTQYCCEDHFDPKEDLKNYYQVKTINQKPVLKPTAELRNIPMCLQSAEESPIEQESNSKLRELLTQTQPIIKKRKYETAVPSTSATTVVSTLPFKVSVHTQCSAKMADKSTQYKVRKTQPSLSSARLPSTPEAISPSKLTSSSPSLIGSTSATEMEDSTFAHNQKSIKPTNKQKFVLDLIQRKPKMYLGLPKCYLWLIDYIVDKSSVTTSRLCLILALFKIKQNDTLERMSDQFELSRLKISSMILQGVQVFVSYLQNFVFMPTLKQIKLNLPMAFKIRYSNVLMIIDCFEIQIVKPSNPQTQAQTWSQYKGCNTIKYLIGCSPNGFVSFVSKGYGGRISDKAIVEESGLIHILPENSVIMADRGFKEIESQLILKNIVLLRPPSVQTGTKQTKAEVLESKVIASLRVHVERVIRRVREFSLLKPHSVVHYKYISYLDEIVIIVCGLINLQGELIKKQ